MTARIKEQRRTRSSIYYSFFLHLIFFLLLKDTQSANGEMLINQVLKGNFTTSVNSSPNCTEDIKSPDLVEAIVYFINGLPPSNLHVVFEERTDQCLMDALWRAGIPAHVLIGPNLKTAFGRSTYALVQQYVVVGRMSWITSAITMARDKYMSDKMNAKGTKWLWVVNASPPKSFHEVLSEVTKTLTEGIRGILLYPPQDLDRGTHSHSRSIGIGSMNIRGDGLQQLHPAGTWPVGGERRRREKGLRILSPLWPSPPFDLYGRLIRMSIVTKPTIFEYEEGQDPEKAGGYAPDLLREIQRKLNFSKELFLTNGFGSMLSDGSWNGMVGVLSRREADLAPLDFTPVYSRTLVIDFGLIYSTDNVILISKAPSSFIRPFILLQIFSPFVWSCWVLTGIIAGLMVSFISKTEAEIYHNNEYETELSRIGQNTRYCWASLKLLVYQGSTWWPKDSSSRLLSGIMMLTVIIFGSLYSGSITAFLAIPSRSQPVNSIEDLIATEIKPAFREGASTYNFFVEQTEGVLGKVKDRMISFSAAQVASWEFFRDIALGRYALIDTSSSALGISAGFEKVGRSCLFHPAREPVRLDLDAFAYPKNSPIIYQFDEIMRWLRSYGIIQYMKNQYYTKACDAVMHSDKSKPLSVTQAQGAFYIISVGLGISLLTFALENLIHNCCST